MGSAERLATSAHTSLSQTYRNIRSASLALCEPLAIEDFVVQSMPDVSPTKWHLAHTTWFFEQFLLVPKVAGYRPFDERFTFLFNSYYESVGERHARPQRGLLTRPTVAEIYEYRNHVDQHMQRLLDARGGEADIAQIATLGFHHEQQHQELMFTDLKHVLSCNPLKPAYRARTTRNESPASLPLEYVEFPEGIHHVGTNDAAFFFDNESPRHRVYLQAFALATRLVTNGEYAQFVRDGGYRRADLWLADGWTHINSEAWNRPLYWSEGLDSEFTLAGMVDLDAATPVSHLSFYEADAFARWAGARLPTEAEWEVAARNAAVAGNFVESEQLHPQAAPATSGLAQLYGDVWEWTASAYAPYPGYQPLAGALGEYNGKFMCNQLVLRGGSCVTPASHIRSTYRNFCYPQARWQFMGVRLARNI